jgi:hypothetical protein
MGVPRAKALSAVACVLALAGAAGSAWGVKAADGPASARPVQALKGRPKPAPVTAGDRGTTYHALESDVVRATTRFADAVATASRTPDGHLATRLTDLAGNEMVGFQVHRVDAETDSLDYTTPGRPTRHAARRAGLRPTLDWGNQQAYSLWKDRDGLDRGTLEWQDTLMRPVGARRRDVDSDAVQADVEWPGGFTGTVTKKVATHASYVDGRQTTGSVYVGRLKRDGIEVGSSQWWPQEQAFAWSFPGLTEGYVNVARLQGAGGWPLTPDMAWINTQNMAFYRFHTLANSRTASSGRGGGWLAKLGGLVSPRLLANEPGCDGLHWMDQSIYRPCCDSHDLCYRAQTPACSASSWWRWWDSWQCDACNIDVVFCFATGGGHVYYRFP